MLTSICTASTVFVLNLEPHNVKGESVETVVFFKPHHLSICPGTGQIPFFPYRKQYNTLTWVRIMVIGNLW